MDVADMLTERLAMENGDYDVVAPPMIVMNEFSPVRNTETRIGLINTADGWRELRVREQNGKGFCDDEYCK